MSDVNVLHDILTAHRWVARELTGGEVDVILECECGHREGVPLPLNPDAGWEAMNRHRANALLDAGFRRAVSEPVTGPFIAAIEYSDGESLATYDGRRHETAATALEVVQRASTMRAKFSKDDRAKLAGEKLYVARVVPLVRGDSTGG